MQYNENNKSNILEEYLNETQLAEHWQVSKKLIQKMRYAGGGPIYVKIGNSVRYSRTEIINFEQRNKHSSTSDDCVKRGSL